MSKWTKLWIALWTVVVGGFFAIEMPAVFNSETGDTMTETVVRNIPYEVFTGIFGLLFGGLGFWVWTHFKPRYDRKRSNK